MRKIDGRLKVPETITELRDDLLQTYGEIGHGRIQLGMAKEKANTAGKILKSAAIQVDYAALRKEKPEIAFLASK
jgi:hypothetical protein